MIAAKNCEVLIAGAGPTGLMMAAQLLRNGVHPMIIDSRNGPSSHSKALAVQARTLEIYRQMGIADEAVENGRKLYGAHLHLPEKDFHIELGDAAKTQTLFPYALIYEQNKNERLLLNVLTKNACAVLWETELLDFEQSDNTFHVRVLHRGNEQVYTCNYLIGADGAHSKVRKQSGISFEGGKYASRFFLADVKLNHPPEASHIHFFMRQKEFLGVFPMHDEGAFRFIGILPKALREKQNLAFAEVEPHIKKIIPEIGIAECAWFTQYNLHHRSVNAFSRDHIFLAGDAAHIHSPAGGQGMNTGLQDATNLAWKMAGLIKGIYQPKILKTYNRERLPIARQLVKTTDRLFSLLTSTGAITSTLRNLFLPAILRFIGSSSQNTAVIFARISQTNIGYRHSDLSLHLSHKTKIKAGDRLPYLPVFDEKNEVETDLQAWCTEAGFALIIMDRLNRIDMQTMRNWLGKNYPAGINTYYLPFSSKNEAVFDAFEVIDSEKKMILVRPDGYIGLIADGVDLLLLKRYFEQVVGFVPKQPEVLH